MKTLLRLFLFLLTLHPLWATPDSGRSRREEEPRVILYSGENFEGVAVELTPRAAIPDLSELRFSDGRAVNDRVSSLRIFGGLHVTLFADADFSGDRIELTDSVRQLGRLPRASGSRGNWDNKLSSIRVSSGNARRSDHADTPDHGYERPPPREPDHTEVRPPSFDPEREIDRAFRELLQRKPTGAETREYRRHIVAEGWDRARLSDEIRSGREYRTREAEAIVGRVYRDLLGREPDPTGLEIYRREIVDHHWDERRLREVIRGSDEYRQRQNQPKPARPH
jgi:hypothetical protein